jgi:hypothetical protein
MKKNFKKTLSLVLAVLMVMTAVPFGVFAADCNGVHVYTEVVYSGDGFHYYKCECGKANIATAEDCSGDKTNAKCGEYKKCEVCEGEYELVKHTFTEKTVDAKFLADAGNCKTVKKYYYNCVNEGCDAKGTETFNGTEKGDCVWDAGVANGDATCTLPGTKVITCTVCSKQKTVVGEALGHNFKEKIKDAAHLLREGTCKVSAIYRYDCTRCNEIGTTSDIYEDNSSVGIHMFIAVENPSINLRATRATCTEQATYYKVCDDCGRDAETLEHPEETFKYGPKEPHDYTNNPVEKYLIVPASCSDVAIYSKSCSDCGDKMVVGDVTDDIIINIEGENENPNAFKWGSILGHEPDKNSKDAVAYKDATCTTAGTYGKCKCKRCDEVYVVYKNGDTALVRELADDFKFEIPATGHTRAAELDQPYIAPTCKMSGQYGKSKCTVCEDVVYIDGNGKELTIDNILTFDYNLSALGHIDNDGDMYCDRVLVGVDLDGDGQDDTCDGYLEPADLCNCLCHGNGFMFFIGWILKWFWQMTGQRPYCECGEAHY